MAALYRLPTGLLGFFGIKDQGEYPSAVGKTIAPTLELLEWLMAANCDQFVTDTIAAFTTGGEKRGTGLTWLVPAGECWLLKGVIGQINLSAFATQNLSGHLAIARVSGAAVFAHTIGETQEAQAMGAPAFTAGGVQVALMGPKIMLPGDEIVFRAVGVTPAAGNFSGFLNGYVLKFQL